MGPCPVQLVSITLSAASLRTSPKIIWHRHVYFLLKLKGSVPSRFLHSYWETWKYFAVHWHLLPVVQQTFVAQTLVKKNSLPLVNNGQVFPFTGVQLFLFRTGFVTLERTPKPPSLGIRTLSLTRFKFKIEGTALCCHGDTKPHSGRVEFPSLCWGGDTCSDYSEFYWNCYLKNLSLQFQRSHSLMTGSCVESTQGSHRTKKKCLGKLTDSSRLRANQFSR